MKILIDNGDYGLSNFGDVAMLIMAFTKLREEFPSAEIRIFTDSVDGLKRHIPDAVPVLINGRRLWYMKRNIFGGLHKIFPLKVSSWIQDLENIIKIRYTELTRLWIQTRLSRRNYKVEDMNVFLNEIKQADIVVADGGGYITNSFEEHASALLQTLALAQSYGKSTAMFGQGLGPVTSKRLLTWAKFVLPKLKMLSLREGLYSKPFALSVGVPPENIQVSGDDAVCLAHSMALSSIGDYIGINLRVSKYSGLKKNILNTLKSDLTITAEEIGAQLCGIPISHFGDDSDIVSLESILDKQALELVKKLCTPADVIKQIGKCRIVITGSYHAGVFALSQGVSVIVIASNDYYRYKFEGLQSQFGDGCIIIDRDKPKFYELLKSGVISSWKSAEKVRSILLEKAESQISLSDNAYQTFSKNLTIANKDNNI